MVNRRRHVLFLAGFDPIDVPSQHRRIQREIARFARTWSVMAEAGGIEPAADGAGDRWRLVVRGPNWAAETTYEPLDWHHVVESELRASPLRRFVGAFVSFCDFTLSGTAYRYATASWQYALFFALPFLNLLSFTVVGLVAGGVAGAAVWPSSRVGAIAVGAVIAVAVLLGLMRWPGRRWRVGQAIDDWIFARDYMYERRGEFDALLDRFADRLVACARQPGCEELIIVGHSLGATLAVDVIARALERDPDVARRGPSICLLTVGATIPKLTLHPAARRLRDCVARVAEHPDIAWTEYQARRDPISFYNFDPMRLTRAEPHDRDRKPRVVLVGIKAMLQPDTYERIRHNHMRLHYQFVMGNEQPAIYDYFMLIAGPASFRLVSDMPSGVLDVVAPDGVYHSDGTAAEGRAS